MDRVEKETGEKLGQMNGESLNIRQTNAVVREIREIEKREKNIVFCNIPESTSTVAEERKKYDEEKVVEILGELGVDDVRPIKVMRVGHEG